MKQAQFLEGDGSVWTQISPLDLPETRPAFEAWLHSIVFAGKAACALYPKCKIEMYRAEL